MTCPECRSRLGQSPDGNWYCKSQDHQYSIVDGVSLLVGVGVIRSRVVRMERDGY